MEAVRPYYTIADREFIWTSGPRCQSCSFVRLWCSIQKHIKPCFQPKIEFGLNMAIFYSSNCWPKFVHVNAILAQPKISSKGLETPVQPACSICLLDKIMEVWAVYISPINQWQTTQMCRILAPSLIIQNISSGHGRQAVWKWGIMHLCRSSSVFSLLNWRCRFLAQQHVKLHLNYFPWITWMQHTVIFNTPCYHKPD